MFGGKFLNSDQYSDDVASGWDAGILRGEPGSTGPSDPTNGTARSSWTILRDTPKAQPNYNVWGGPFSGVTLFGFADGTVHSITYEQSGTPNFYRLLHPSDGKSASIDE